MALLDDVVDFLEGQGLVNDGSGGWTAFKSYLPDSPDRAVAIFETPGEPAEVVKPGTGQAYDFPGFQVRIRGAEWDYEAMRARLYAIFLALHDSDMGSVTTGSPQYLMVRSRQSGPFPLGLDERSRPGATWNFSTWRERGA
jgi:hypothetical protein